MLRITDNNLSFDSPQEFLLNKLSPHSYSQAILLIQLLGWVFLPVYIASGVSMLFWFYNTLLGLQLYVLVIGTQVFQVREYIMTF